MKKQKITHILLLLFFMLGAGSRAIANNTQDTTACFTFHFKVGNSAFNPDYRNNRQVLDNLKQAITADYTRATAITVTGTSSPEGGRALNERLAKERAEAIRTYLQEHFSQIFPSEPIEITSKIRGWDEVRAIAPEKTYAYLRENVFPQLRTGTVRVMLEYEIPVPIVVEIETTPEPEPIVPVIIEPATVEPEPKKHFVALKTNLLYDAVLVPNLAVEVSLGKRWSVELEGQYAWWRKTTDAKSKFHRTQSLGLEVRKWLGHADRTPLTGHYLGVYGMGGTYDMKWGDTGRMSNGSYSVGLSYGYAMPIGRRLNLEFGIGVGYWWGEYKKYTYDPIEKVYPWEETKDRNYIGPTKAKVSLVWLIGNGVNNPPRK